MPTDFGTAGIADYKYSIYCNYNTSVTIPSLEVSQTNVSIGYGSGSSATFNITSNTTWNITDDANWLDVAPVSGSNNGVITITANSANTGTSTRTATVTISGAGISAKTVTVTQEVQELTSKSIGNTEVYNLSVAMADRRAMPVTFSEPGEITSISVYHNGSTGNVLLGVFSDLLGLPSSRLGVTASTAGNASAGWQTVPLTSPVTVYAGQTVWLAWVFQNSTSVRYSAGTPGRAHSPATWTAGMPTDFGTAGIADYKYSIYCNYTTTKSAEIATTITPDIEKADLKVYPNPFSDRLRFEFVSPESVNARIDLYDMTGRLVKNIFEQPVEGGVSYEAEFRPETIISGMYLYRVTLGETVYNGKVVLKK
jgi:hypothetical protein